MGKKKFSTLVLIAIYHLGSYVIKCHSVGVQCLAYNKNILKIILKRGLSTIIYR